MKKKMFLVDFGCYSGVLMDEIAMKKVSKLYYRQNEELKQLLLDLKEHIVTSNWTLAYPNGKQEAVYYSKADYKDDIESRINVIDKAKIIQLVHFYDGTQEEAINEHMKLYDDNIDRFNETK
jgi:hypothetical protein